MTLHEAIEKILLDVGKPLTSREIADVINKEKIYKRSDAKPVPASQITARVRNYTEIFSQESGKIKLLKDDKVSLSLQRFKNELSSISNSYAFRDIEGKKSFTEILKRLSLEYNFEFDNDIDNYEISEQFVPFNINSNIDNLKIAFYLSAWYLPQDSNFTFIFTEYFASLLSGFNWFKIGFHDLVTDIQSSNHFLLKLVIDNPKATFKVNTLESEPSSAHFDMKSDNHSVIKFNNIIEDLINVNKDYFDSNYASIRTKIIVPSFDHISYYNSTFFFSSISEELKFDSPRFEKAILILPVVKLMSLKTSDEYERERFVKSGFLDSVILFPNKMIEKSGIRVSVLIFDFNKKNNEVFFFDSSDFSEDDVKNVNHVINNKIQIKDVSKSVSHKDIFYNTYSLYPGDFVFDPRNIDIKSGYEQYSLSDLIVNQKSGVNIKNRQSLYSGGEYKIIRPNEISTNILYFEIDENMLGIDHDEILDIEKILVRGGIVVSGFNNKLKASILSNEDTYALGQDVYWLKLNNNLIFDEYLVKEFSEDYITKQVKYYSRGTTIPKLYFKDLLKIQLQIPSKEIQKEILFANSKKEIRSKERSYVTDKESDFIKTLKHTLKQPASSLGNDFSTLRAFLNNKVDNKTPLLKDEIIVPIFSNDTNEQISIYSLSNTLDRIFRSITDIDYVLNQAVQVIEIAKPLKKNNLNLIDFLQNFVSEYPDINIQVIGAKLDIFADIKQLRILFHNLINNAIRHGFKSSSSNPTVWLEIKLLNRLSVQISVRNNGAPLPREFTIEDFLAKGNSSNFDVGSGFGGFLVGRILENHNGEIILKNKDQSTILEHNVEFLITLPI